MNSTSQPSLLFTISQHLLKLMSIESMMLSNHLILCRQLLLPSIFASIRVFSSESDLPIRWPKYWSFNSASVLPVNVQGWFPLGLTGLISLLSKGLPRDYTLPSSKCKDQPRSLHFFFCIWFGLFLWIPQAKSMLKSMIVFNPPRYLFFPTPPHLGLHYMWINRDSIDSNS